MNNLITYCYSEGRCNCCTKKPHTRSSKGRPSRYHRVKHGKEQAGETAKAK